LALAKAGNLSAALIAGFKERFGRINSSVLACCYKQAKATADATDKIFKNVCCYCHVTPQWRLSLKFRHLHRFKNRRKFDTFNATYMWKNSATDKCWFYKSDMR